MSKRIKHEDRQLVLLPGGLSAKPSPLEENVKKEARDTPANNLADYAFTLDDMKIFRSTPPPRHTHLSRNYYFL